MIKKNYIKGTFALLPAIKIYLSERGHLIGSYMLVTTLERTETLYKSRHKIYKLENENEAESIVLSNRRKKRIKRK